MAHMLLRQAVLIFAQGWRRMRRSRCYVAHSSAVRRRPPRKRSIPGLWRSRPMACPGFTQMIFGHLGFEIRTMKKPRLARYQTGRSSNGVNQQDRTIAVAVCLFTS